MCGILFFHAPDGRAPQGGELDAMNALHSLRGPDASGQQVLADGRLALAHTRLSVIDLSEAANQPMSCHGGRQWIVFNGEIYNHPELRTRLESRGEALRTRCDTEVLLRLLAVEGPDALELVEGMFAFVHVDLEAGSILAARDRVGIKPLYACTVGGVTGYASTLNPLTRLEGFTGRIDPTARFEMLVSKYVAAPRSIYSDIRKIPAGHYEVSRIGDSAAPRSKRWWSPKQWMVPGEGLPALDSPASEWERTLETAVDGAVARQLVADVPVGVFLSGGIDSSLVAALAARRVGGVKTFSIGYAESEYDESAHAEAVARHIGSDHHALQVRPAEVMELLTTIGSAYDEPFGDASAVPTYIVSRMARDHVAVALSGDGGDEQFFGYTRHHYMARAYPVIRHIPKFVRAAVRRLSGNAPRSRWRHALGAFLGFPDGQGLYTHHVLENFAAQAELVGAGARELLWRTGLDAVHRDARRMCGGDFLKSLSVTDLCGYMVDDCLVKVDRASMAHSLEVRVPLLDEAVLRASLPMPVALSWQGGQGKALLRRVLYRHVPRRLVDRPKMGFGVPLDKWLFNELREFTMDTLTRENVTAAGLDFKGVRRLMEAHESGMGDFQYFLWPLICYINWYRERRGVGFSVR